jgi:hypothetical protein
MYRLSVHLDSAGRTVALYHAFDPAHAQRASAGERAVKKRLGEPGRMNLRCRIGGTERTRHHGAAVDPARRRDPMAAGHGAVLARRQHIRVHPTVAVVIRDLTRELGVQREARPGERAQGRVVAPVESDESAGLARGCAGYPGAFDHGDRDAAPGQEVGDRGADHAGAADDDVARRSHMAMLPTPAAHPRDSHEIGDVDTIAQGDREGEAHPLE